MWTSLRRLTKYDKGHRHKRVHNFFLPFMGATRMRHPFAYPKKTQPPPDYLYETPKSGLEMVEIYGPHTLELKNLPWSRTPEYMQERLRRHFSKFGMVRHLRALPHPLDPYQCEGTAYVTFKEGSPVVAALAQPLQLCGSLYDKVIRMKHLVSGKSNDPTAVHQRSFANGELISLTRQLHEKCVLPQPLDSVWRGIREREFGTDRIKLWEAPEDLPAFFLRPPLDQLFDLKPAGEPKWVQSRLLSNEHRERHLNQLGIQLDSQLKAELSEHWRAGKPKLPGFTQELTNSFLHQPPLPEALQMTSRNSRTYKIFDERFLFQKKRRAAQKRLSQLKKYNIKS